jgi:hypothetical protein
MKTGLRFDPDLLRWASGLSAEQRLRQANAAFRLRHALHGEPREPWIRTFDTLEDFRRFTEENDLRR